MIADFEARLADVLGTRMAAPFTGRVDVAPGGVLEAAARVILGVSEARSMEPDLGSARRTETLPGAAVPRRAVRLRCTVSLEARANPASRVEELRALDAAIYALDARELREGKALTDGTDRGFLISELLPITLGAPLRPDDESPVALKLTATGLFWPVGVGGEAGKVIGEIHFRGGVLPLQVTPADPPLTAGGVPVELTMRFATAGMVLRGDQPASKLPFGAIAAVLRSAGGKAGKGSLGGGSAGAAGLRIYPITGDAATLTYTPPPAAGVDDLIIGFDDGDNGLGIEIGRVSLQTRNA